MGGGKTETKVPLATVTQTERGTDFVTEAKGTGTAAQSTSKEEPASKAEATSTDSWTLESALKEVKKLRDENKQVRVRYEDTVTTLKKELDERVQTIESKYQPLTEAAKELEDLKKKEEDKKRDINEKLANREALLAEAKARSEALARDYEAKLSTANAELLRFQAEHQAQTEVYKNKLNEELLTIPEKFKGVAELLVKGAGDPRDALVALGEAKIRGMFEDRTVVVNHSVPGAKDGARTTSEAVNEKLQAELNRLSGTQKIQIALKEMQKGNDNAAFKNHNFKNK